MIFLVCGLISALLVAWKQRGGQGSEGAGAAALRAARLLRSGSGLRAAGAAAHGTGEQLAEAKQAFVETAKARLAEMKQARTAASGPTSPLLRTQTLDRQSSASLSDPTHYPDVPKPPRPPHCRRGYHATVLECGPAAYGRSTRPRQGFRGTFWPTAAALDALPNFAELGSPQWSDQPLEIDYGTARFKAIAEDFPSDKFAARWEGMFKVERAGEYTFYSQSDDGSKVYVDTVGEGKEYALVVDNDGTHDSSQIVAGKVTLDAGWFPILVSYFEGIGDDNELIKLKYSGPDTEGHHDYVEGYHLPSQSEDHTLSDTGAGASPPQDGGGQDSEEASNGGEESAGSEGPAGPAWPLSYWEVAGAGVADGATPPANPYYMYDDKWVGGGGFSFSNIGDDIVPGTMLEARDWGKWERAFEGTSWQSGQWVGWRTPIETGSYAKIMFFIKVHRFPLLSLPTTYVLLLVMMMLFALLLRSSSSKCPRPRTTSASKFKGRL